MRFKLVAAFTLMIIINTLVLLVIEMPLVNQVIFIALVDVLFLILLYVSEKG